MPHVEQGNNVDDDLTFFSTPINYHHIWLRLVNTLITQITDFILMTKQAK